MCNGLLYDMAEMGEGLYIPGQVPVLGVYDTRLSIGGGRTA